MSFIRNFESADPFASLTPKDLCVECGQKIQGGYVRYDLYSEPELIKCVFMHAACAALMGQRLIADGYLNRDAK
nr:hypothetical protein [Gammaproteobacteria bacterium]